jgi:uncharacterized protein YndB with AHSA1/START domain
MAAVAPNAEGTLRLTRLFRAPREKVFQAWTDPESLKQWWGPPGYVTPSAEIDLRAGGGYRLGMRKLPDGAMFYLTGIYREIRPPERLVYTWRWEHQPALGDTLVTVEFHARAGGTEVVLTHEGFPTAEARQGHDKGWNGSLDRLQEML